MNAWIIGGAFALILCAAIVMIFRRLSAQQLLLMQRMRTSSAYIYVQPLLQACREQRIERISLRAEAVLITLYSPVGKRYECIFDRYGLDPLEPEPLSALAQLTAVEIPQLADNRRYFFKKHRERLENGASQVWYEYMVQPKYKDNVLRAHYDRGAN